MNTPLYEQDCSPQHGHAMSAADAQLLLAQLPGWSIQAATPSTVPCLIKSFRFVDFHATMAFVNAIAQIAHAQDHHPDMSVSYNLCTVSWSTHSVNGLSISDFICAARVDRQFTPTV